MAAANSLPADQLKRPEVRDIAKTIGALLILLAGALYLISGVKNFADTQHKGTAYEIAALWAMAYCVAGFLVGFLFGIPRVLQGSESASASKEKSTSTGYAQRVNTNLEQISDWLTKIIVGLGLVQLRSVPRNLYDAATWMARSFSISDPNLAQAAASFATGIIVLFSVTGFVGGYLVTRLFIAGAFRRADTETTQKENASGISDDEAKKKLAQFWKPDDKEPNPDNEKQLLEWMSKEGINTPERKISIGLFINTPKYKAQRVQAVQDLLE
jgi:hypothetical protein